MNPSVPVITVDGPTASGKGTIAQRVATELGFHLLDSGALYRLTALASGRLGIDEADISALAHVASTLHIRFDDCGGIWLEGEEVSAQIRAEAIGNRASAIAVHGPVRAALIERQRAFRTPPGLVADGRDMGTVIFPDAQFKVFLTASVEARATRRHNQLRGKGFPANIRNLLEDLKARDARDSQRAAAPLKAAADALTIDSSELSIDAVVERVLDGYRKVAQ